MPITHHLLIPIIHAVDGAHIGATPLQFQRPWLSQSLENGKQVLDLAFMSEASKEYGNGGCVLNALGRTLASENEKGKLRKRRLIAAGLRDSGGWGRDLSAAKTMVEVTKSLLTEKVSSRAQHHPEVQISQMGESNLAAHGSRSTAI